MGSKNPRHGVGNSMENWNDVILVPLWGSMIAYGIHTYTRIFIFNTGIQICIKFNFI